jgi:hypothetical protein
VYEPGSSGSIVSSYGLDYRAMEVRSPAGAKDFSSILCVQTGYGAHPASCTMGTGGPFPGGKSAAEAWRWPLTPIYCRGREWVGAIPLLPPSACVACSGTALAFSLSILGIRTLLGWVYTEGLPSSGRTAQHCSMVHRQSCWKASK